jgi:LAGLIDADG DNA endonuclease family
LPFLRFKIRAGVVLSSLRLNTRFLPCFTELYPLFYLNGTKIVPLDIFNRLTPEALAHWIMGDGAVNRVGMTLCTDSYTVSDIVRLMNVLMVKYSLDCTLYYHGVYPRIYIRSGSMACL